jgi:tRNA A37 methylthiotransferase MiaB
VAELEDFLTRAQLDVVGVFGYSDEDGTEAEQYADKLSVDVVAERVARVSELVEGLTAERAEDRVGELVEVLLEELDPDTGQAVGRAAHQGPDVDGVTTLRSVDLPAASVPGQVVTGRVVAAEGVDLVAVPR